MRNGDIAIIGMGAHYPGALDLKKLWENIISRREQFRRFPDERLPIDTYSDITQGDKDKSYVTQGAFIDGFEFDWLGYRVPKKTVESTDIVHWLTYEVAQIALKDAGYIKQNIPKNKTGVILGNTLTGEETRTSYLRQRWPYVERVMKSTAKDLNLTEEQTELFIERSKEYYKSVFPEMTEDSLSGGLANTIAGRVCNTFDLHGGGYTVDGACSSSLIAISTASEKLSSGVLDMAIAGGVDVSLDTFEMVGFARTGALTVDKMRVYDKRANGFMPGEGCGLIVMKRLEDARRDGDKVYAVIKGWGVSSDGRGAITAPNGIYQGLALQRAYDMAGYSAQELDFIEGHGTGTAVGDREEIKGIAINVGTEIKDNNLRSCGVTSFKSLSGHTKAASGVAGLIKTALSLNQRVIPPTAGCDEPNLSFNEPEGRNIYPILLGEKCETSRTLRAGVSAMGFGGINTHITLESADSPFKELQSELSVESLLSTTQKSEIYPFCADSIEELVWLTKRLKRESFGMSVAELPDLASSWSKELLTGKIRAIVIASHPAQLQKSLKKLIDYLETAHIESGKIIEIESNQILLSSSLTKPRVAFVYPGQGSQQLNMAYNLVRRFDWAKDMLSEAEEILKASGWEEKSLSDFIYRPTDRLLDTEQKEEWFSELTNTDIAQPAICFASALWTERLRRLGVTPSVLGGHSLGELSAFSSAGAFDFKSLVALSQLRGDAMQNTESRGSMAAVLESLSTVERLLNSIDGYLTVANINSPKQIVVSGDSEAIDRLITLATEQEIRAKKLNVSNAFHSKLVEEASKVLHEKAPISEALNSKCKIISSVTTEEVGNDINMVSYFGDQVLNRVDFVGLVDEMRKECDIFVEVGPGAVLSNMISYIDQDIVALPVESEAMNDVSLNKLLAHYYVSGGDIDWHELYDSRLIRDFTPSSEKKFIESSCEKAFNVKPLSPEIAERFNVKNREVVSSSGNALSEVIETLQRIQDSKIIDAVEMLSGVTPLINTPTKESHTIKNHPIENDGQKIALSPASKPQKKRENSRVKDTLFLKISEMTGFPKESLELDLKLLDDLNLDSIKATELIVETTQELGLDIELDPAPLANATLQEIVDVLNEHMGNDVKSSNIDDDKAKNLLYKKIEKMTGFPEESLELDLKLLDDLNLDSIKATELIVETTQELGLEIELDPAPLANATLQEIIDIFNNHTQEPKKKVSSVPSKDRAKPWVRNFIMESQFEELTDIDKGAIASESRVLIISEEQELDIVNALVDELRERSGVEKIKQYLFTDIKEDEKLLNESELEYIVLILPREKSVEGDGEAIYKMVDRLSVVSKLKSNLTLSFIQFAGGRFGIDDGSLDIEQTGSLAWASSLHLEQKDLRVRVVDFDKELEGKKVAKKLLEELSSDSKFSSAGYGKGMLREVLYPRLHQSDFDKKSDIEWSSGDTILVTGGAKGITAECAIAFAKKTKVKMALVGSSKVPSPHELCEINTTLNRFRNLGVEARYYSCNLSDTQSVEKSISQIREDLGEVSGVIHGAGLNHPTPLSYVSSDSAKGEISPKVFGAINILNQFESKPLKMFISLTSIIGVSGMIGNGWYGFSNEVLDILVAQYAKRHPQTKVVSTAYSVWGETGMGAKMGSTDYLEKMGIMAIPTADGVERFLGLALNDAPARQVVITAKLEGLDTWRTKPLTKPYSNRYLENIVYSYPKVNVISEVHLTLEKDPYLKDHVWKSSNLFPTVFGLESMAQVVAYMMNIDSFKNLKIENINLQRPIAVHPTNGLKIQINALALERKSADAPQKVKVTISTEKSQFQTEHFSATFLLDGAENFEKETQGLPAYAQERLEIDAKKDLYSWLLFQGPLFQRLSDFYQIDNDMMVFDSLTEEGEEKHWMLGSPYVRDSLLQSVQPMVPEHGCLPVFIDSISIADTSMALPKKIRGVSFNEELVEKEYRTSVYGLSDERVVYEKLEGYRLQIIDYRQEFPTDIPAIKTELYEEEELSDDINILAQYLNGINSNVTIQYVPTLSKMSREERHKVIKPMAEAWLKREGIESQLNWDGENKPILDGNKHILSISHSKSYLLMQVTDENAGCDIEHILHRSSEMWSKILTLKSKNYQDMMDRFQEGGESEDMAGTRLWSIRESIYKAIGEFTGEISINFIEDGVALIKAKDERYSLELLSLPIETRNGAECMVTFTIKRGSDESYKSR